MGLSFSGTHYSYSMPGTMAHIVALIILRMCELVWDFLKFWP